MSGIRRGQIRVCLTTTQTNETIIVLVVVFYLTRREEREGRALSRPSVGCRVSNVPCRMSGGGCRTARGDTRPPVRDIPSPRFACFPWLRVCTMCGRTHNLVEAEDFLAFWICFVTLPLALWAYYPKDKYTMKCFCDYPRDFS